MADFVCNVAKGRVAELYERVDAGDPASARLLVVPVSAGAVTDDQMGDADTLAALLALGVTERNSNGWTRKTLAAADLPARAPDDTNNRQDVGAGLANLTWTAVAGAGGATTDVVICYIPDGVTPGADSTAIPLTVHDFAITPDGSNVVLQFNAAGIFRAT